MEIKRNGSQPSTKAPAEHFTGTARWDPVFQPTATLQATGTLVTFEPCSRTDWHTHPKGQILIVTYGCGLVQSWGHPIKEIRPGDVVYTAPGEKHWHGATPTSAMSHLAIYDSVDWLEKVTEDQYRGLA